MESERRISEEELDDKIRAAVAASRQSFVAELDSRIQQSLTTALAGLSRPPPQDPPTLPPSGGEPLFNNYVSFLPKGMTSVFRRSFRKEG